MNLIIKYNFAVPNIFQRLIKWIQAPAKLPTGKIRNLTPSLGGSSVWSRLNDLEIPEQISRDTIDRRNRSIVELCYHCQPVIKAWRIIVDDVFSSQDGSDWSLSISKTLSDNKTPVNPEIKRIGDDLLHRIGLQNLKVVAKRAIAYGDSFSELVLSPMGKDRYQVSNVVTLPTFQLFRLESDHGELLGFEQRRGLYGEDTISFSPTQIVHFRCDLETLYGKGIFSGCRDDWDKLKSASIALDEALRTANNPLVYTIPNHWSQDQFDTFRDEKERAQAEGVRSQIFLTDDVTLQRLSSNDPTLRALIEPVLMLRRSIKDQCRLPSWNWQDESSNGSERHIAGQPALSYIRFLSSIRQDISVGIRQIIDTALILQGYVEPDSRQYELQWPTLQTNTVDATAENQEIQEQEGGQGEEPTIAA